MPQDETQESVTEDISDSELEDIPGAEEPDDPFFAVALDRIGLVQSDR